MNADLTLTLGSMACPQEFGHAVTALLNKHGLSLRQAARMAGVTHDFVWRVTHGRNVGAANRARLVRMLASL